MKVLMTKEILTWLDSIYKHILSQPGRVLEVGSLDVNGTPRYIFANAAVEYIGTDMEAGAGVDKVLNNRRLLETFGAGSFDTVICCEVLEHDSLFWDTITQIRDIVKPGGYLVITTPTFGFPLHKYPFDLWRFGEDAYHECFFAGWDVLNVMHLDSSCGKDTTLAGIARKPAH